MLAWAAGHAHLGSGSDYCTSRPRPKPDKYGLKAFVKEPRLLAQAPAKFFYAGRDWTKHVEHDPGLSRPSDVAFNVGRPDKARQQLGWTPGARMPDVVKRLVEDELRLAREPAVGIS